MLAWRVDHLGRLLGRAVLEHGPIEVHGHEVRQQPAEHRLRRRLEQVLVIRLGLALAHRWALDRQHGADHRPLGEGVDEGRVGQLDAIVRPGQVILGDQPRDRGHVGEGRPIAELREVRRDRHACAPQRVATLAPDGNGGELDPVLAAPGG